MTAHYNRASHANPYRTWQHVEPSDTPLYVFRISPANLCLIEWRRNERGGVWLYWCKRQTPEEAQLTLENIERAGLTIERQR